MNVPTTAEPKSPDSGRLLSIDALRGFDMFWIIGGAGLVRAWVKCAAVPGTEAIQEQLEHVPWEGFRFYDLIFPLFLFLVGVVLPFSLGKMRERGEPRSRLYGRIIRRAVLLFALGLIFNGLLQKDFRNIAAGDLSDVRFAGVLQRIAICYLVAGVIVIHTRAFGQTVILAGLLLGYWALLMWVPAPGSQAGDYTPKGSLPGYVDRNWLPGKMVAYGYGDNEGYLSTFPAIGTALLGVLAGQWLRSLRGPWTKAIGLALAGCACLAAAYYWGYRAPDNLRFPIIKNIWTSSYVLLAGGWSLLLLALFYLVIDVLGFRAWAFFFVVIGVNAITIYIGQALINFHYTAQVLFGGAAPLTGSFQPAYWATADFLVKWLFLLFLFRHKIYLRA
jgi:predicted acyltransferase